MSKEEEKKVNVINNNDFLVKLAILKNALLDERKKTENLQKENNKLTEENTIIKEKNNKLNEENIIKQEQIEKLKEELIKYKNKNNNNNIHKFFNQFFEEESEKLDNETLEALDLLKEENKNLKEEINSMKNEKNFINSKLNESIKDFNELQLSYEKKLKELEKNKNDIIENIEKNKKEKEEKYKKEIEEKNKILNEKLEKVKYLTEYIKTFDSQKADYNNKISKVKMDLDIYEQNLNKKNEEIQILFCEQEHLLQEIEEYKKEIQELKVQITQYKVLLNEFKPISIAHIFTGYLIPKENNGNLKIVEISFGKIKNKLSFKIEKEDELILSNKEVVDIIEDKDRKNRVKIILKVNKVKNHYICDFTEKEVQMILEFFYQFKKKPSLVESALMGMNTDYFY